MPTEKRNGFSTNFRDSQTKIKLASRKWTFLFVAAFACAVDSFAAPQSGGVDLSGSVSYYRQNYGAGEGFAFNRRWSTGLSYRINDMSSIELYYAQSHSESHLTGIRDTIIEDQVYSLNWVQSLLGSDYRIVPYFKVGVGNLEREAQQYEDGVLTGEANFKSLSAVLGFGLLIRVVERISLRAEATSYIPEARIAEWQNNYSFNIGLTLHL